MRKRGIVYQKRGWKAEMSTLWEERCHPRPRKLPVSQVSGAAGEWVSGASERQTGVGRDAADGGGSELAMDQGVSKESLEEVCERSRWRGLRGGFVGGLCGLG